MRYTLRLLMIGAALPMLAGAQVPTEKPVRPPTPDRPERPVPTPKVRPEPRLEMDIRTHIQPLLDLKYDFKYDFHVDEVRWKAEEMKLHADELRWQAKDLAQVNLESMRFDTERIRQEALESLKNTRFDYDFGPALSAWSSGIKTNIGGGLGRPEKFLESKPRAPWASEDPADSLYRVAREAISRGEYRRAAQLFNEVVKKYPRSTYAVDCAYWEAFARYRSGTDEDLKAALKIIDDGRVQFAQLRNNGEGSVDVEALRARVLGALASRGDRKAAEELQRSASQRSSCDREEISVKAEALSALGQMDAATALPIVKKVLANRDECTVELRRRALYVVARQQTGTEAAAIVLDVARNDPDNGIRGEAMRLLPRIAGEAAVPQLEEILRTSSDEQTQRLAISALGSIDSERARKAVRTIVERNDAAERIRYEAILTLSREREGRPPTLDEQAYVRSMYGKLESQRLKEAALQSIGRNESPENQAFLLAIVRNQNEAPSLRSTALSRVGRMNTVTAAEIAKLYDIADTRSLREQILNSLSQRKEDEAVDKMIEIGKKDTDPQIRRYAIMLLSRSNNERAKQFLKDMWNQ